MVAAILVTVPGTASAGTQTFGYVSKSPQTFTVPDGVTQLSVTALGARGGVVSTGYDPASFGPDTRQSGIGGYAQGLVPVVPGQVLQVYVGQYGSDGGGWGWASGGEGGLGYYESQGNLTAYSGAGGGGASAILAGPGAGQIVAVGGGGGGNGGRYVQLGLSMPGGNGGNGGLQGLPGWDGDSGAPGGTSPNGHGKVGGCGGCQTVPQGYEGESLILLQPGGAGGGGGGGFNGGGGGNNGFRSEFRDGLAGSGGGGGSSYIAPNAIDSSTGVGSPPGPCSMTAGGGAFDPDCYGSVTFTWASAPQTVAIQGASSANATIGGQFGDFKVLVTDADGVPVPNATVTFSGPSTGAGGSFPGGENSSALATDAHGIATLSGLKANGSGGNWNLTATATGGSSPSATFAMTNYFDSSTTTVSANPDPSYRGQTVEIYANVAAGDSTVLPTGQVLFSIDDAPVGAPVPIGAGNRATLPGSLTADLDVGTHSVTALYLGDTGHAGSQDTESQVVQPTPTSITVASSVNPSGSGEEIDLTASVVKIAGVAGTPTGAVEFRDDESNLLGSVPLDGTGKAVFTFEPTESVELTASYGGDAESGGSTGRFVQGVGPEATSTVISSSQSPVIYGATPTFTAQVRRTDQGAAIEGTVGIEIDGEVACPDADVDGDGRVTCTPTNPIDAGVHEVDAKYNPPDDSLDEEPDKPSTGSFNQVVLAAPSRTAVSMIPEPSVFGQPTTLNVGVTLPDNPGLSAPGSASFLIDGISAGELTLTDGTASRTDACVPPGTCPYSAGSHLIEADYTSSNPNLLSGDASAHHQVTAAPTVTTIVSDEDPVKAGSPVTFTATVASSPVAGSPPGRVAFSARGAAIGNPVAVVNGTATSAAISSLPEGTHQVTARYLGANDFGPSEVSLTQRVTAPDVPDRGHPALRFKGTQAKVRRGSVKLEMICGGDRGMTCRGLVTLRNRKAVKLIQPGRKKGRKKGRKTVRKIRPGQLLAKKSLTLGAGDTAYRTFKLSRLGKKVFLSGKRSVPSLIRVSPAAGTDPTAPYRLRIYTGARAKPKPKPRKPRG